MAIGARDGRLALVLDLARQVTARRNLDDVLATTFACLRPMLAFTGGSIQLLDDDGWIRMAATDPAAPAHVLAMRIPLGSTVGGRIVLTEQPVYVADVLADSAVPADRRKAGNLSRGVRSYLGVPLVAEGRAIGLIQIDSAEPDAWDEDERVLLSSVAPIVAAAIQNARAHAVQQDAARRLAEAETRVGQAREALATLLPAVASLTTTAPLLPRQGQPGGAAVGRVEMSPADARLLLDALELLAASIGLPEAGAEQQQAQPAAPISSTG